MPITLFSHHHFMSHSQPNIQNMCTPHPNHMPFPISALIGQSCATGETCLGGAICDLRDFRCLCPVGTIANMDTFICQPSNSGRPQIAPTQQQWTQPPRPQTTPRWTPPPATARWTPPAPVWTPQQVTRRPAITNPTWTQPPSPTRAPVWTRPATRAPVWTTATWATTTQPTTTTTTQLPYDLGLLFLFHGIWLSNY